MRKKRLPRPLHAAPCLLAILLVLGLTGCFGPEAGPAAEYPGAGGTGRLLGGVE